MSSIKRKIEQLFANVTDKIFSFRWPMIVLMIVLAAVSARQLPKLSIDMSDEGFLHENDPILQTYNDFRDQFGRDDLIVLAIESDNLFSQSFLGKLKKLHRELEDKLPHLDDITSMVNARNTRGVSDGIIVEDLLEKWPQDQQALDKLRQRVLSNPLYLNRLISEDGRFTTVIIKTDAYSGTVSNDEVMNGFDDLEGSTDLESPSSTEKAPTKHTYLSEKERGKIVMAAKKIAAKYQSDDFKINLAGSPVVTNTVKKTMRQDMMLFLRLAVLVIAASLLLMFRRLSAVIYPLLVVILSLISTLALMTVFGVSIKMPTMILPSFILAVGVGDSVHILSIFLQNFKLSNNKREALVKAMGHSGLAVVMTSLTTAAGLASFFSADIAPVADLGIFAAAGVMLAMLYTIIFLPALLAVTPLKNRSSGKASTETSNKDDSFMGRLMDAITNLSTRHSKGVVIIFLILIAISLAGASKLKFSHNVLSWLPHNMPVRSATQEIDHNLKGSVTLELVLDTGRENGLYDPDILNKMDKLAKDLEGAPRSIIPVGKVMSIVDIIKEIHRALNENRPEFYIVPQQEKLIPQEFLLFENSGSNDLEDVVDSRFQLARITIKVPWQDAMNYVPFIAKVESRAQALFGPDIKITTTGIMSLFGRIIFAAIHSAATSYMIAFGVISLMMIFLIGSVRLGLLCMLPNLAPILMTIGLMGWLGLPLDMFTMLIGSIAIGLAVDDTIHFVYNFRKYYAQHKEPVAAVRQTLHTVGRAMLTTTVVLSLGFFIFMFASMSNLYNFGLLTGIALLLALSADFLLAPALLNLVADSSVGRAEIINQ